MVKHTKDHMDNHSCVTNSLGDYHKKNQGSNTSGKENSG
jgi:hypothetical protein